MKWLRPEDLVDRSGAWAALALFLLLILAVLLVACESEAAEEPAEWIVTGTELSFLSDERWVLSATLSDGNHDGEWKWTLPLADDSAEDIVYECWKSATIGEAVPACMLTSPDAE